MYPLDVVKTRFQLQVKGTGEQYNGMIDCFRKIIKNEGYTPSCYVFLGLLRLCLWGDYVWDVTLDNVDLDFLVCIEGLYRLF